MQSWWSEATRDPGNDGGGFSTGAFKGVLHTTEGSSYASARNAFVAENSWPHFTVSFESGAFHAWQHVPLTRAARSLKHPRGTAETNRARAIQIEIVADAVGIRALPGAYLDGLARLMRWIEAQVGVKKGTAPAFKAYPASYGEHNGVRFDASRWLAFDGWCGHEHVPFNVHGDPGAINIKRLLAAPQPLKVAVPGGVLAAGPSTVVTGVDRAGAPSLAEATAIRDGAKAKWWGVYIGGPCSAGSGWTPARVRQLAGANMEFMPIYVGQQSRSICRHHTLSSTQGTADGHDATRIMRSFDWQPNRGIPVALDVEAGTFSDEPTATLDYIAAWVRAVRSAGYRPGVYSSPSCLTALSSRSKPQQPDFVWIAAWLLNPTLNPGLDPKNAHGIPAGAWRNNQRAWQYAGSIRVPGGQSAVDVSCSNLILAPRPGGTAAIPTDPVLQLGSGGPAVTTLKHLLVVFGKTHPLPKPLADTPVFGEATLEAVKAFQGAHHIQPTGKVGAPTWRALRAAAASPA